MRVRFMRVGSRGWFMREVREGTVYEGKVHEDGS